ncbi:MAG: Hpt domain-containing protein [Bacteroidota bacterium]
MKTDLTYLREMSAGNKELVREMIEIFITQVNDFYAQMDELLEQKEWDKLGKLCHKAKSSVSIMGQDKLAKDLKWVEIDSKTNKTVEKYPEIIQRFKDETTIIVKELTEVSENIDNYF